MYFSIFVIERREMQMGNKAIRPHPERIERVNMLMNKENLSQTKLAEKTGIAQQRISSFLSTGKISDYYLEKIKTAFPEYLPEWLEGYGDPEIATKEDLARQKFNTLNPSEEDLTDYFHALDGSDLLDQLTEKLKLIDPIRRMEVLELLNKIVEPYTLIPEWKCQS